MMFPSGYVYIQMHIEFNGGIHWICINAVCRILNFISVVSEMEMGRQYCRKGNI